MQGRPRVQVPAHAAALLPALAAALDGGPTVVPVAPANETAGVAAAGVAVAGVAAAGGEGAAGWTSREDDPHVALVVPTSGSTGEPKGVLLTAASLTASARASAEHLGGEGQWLLALPPTHIGGLQVLVRSLLAGIEPTVLPGRLTAAALVAAAAGMTGPRRYASLVPTQLRRLLAEPASDEALTAFDAVLLGGAAAEPDLLERAAAVGARVVTTYGASETSGGCVYDGRPLAGVEVSLEDGRVQLAGPVVALGYTTGERFRGSFATGDLGRRRPDGTLEVLGRADDMIISGGVNVAPAAVVSALLRHPSVADAAVVGVPDQEWGARVRAVVVLHAGASLSLAEARDRVGAERPRSWAPRELLVVPALPLLPGGKIDRLALVSAPRQDPIGQSPTSPAPTSPAPTSPAPTSPAPTSPAPTSPAPTSPAPSSPAPTSPAPTSPAREP